MEAKAIYNNLYILIIFIYLTTCALFLIIKKGVASNIISVDDFNNLSKEFTLSLVLPVIPKPIKFRDSKGRFRSPNIEDPLPVIDLSKEIRDPLIGNLLGDGYLGFTLEW